MVGTALISQFQPAYADVDIGDKFLICWDRDIVPTRLMKVRMASPDAALFLTVAPFVLVVWLSR
jgi:hypothetical protein